MIQVNEKNMEWRENLSISEVFKFLGIKKPNPSVIVQMNGNLIRKKDWGEIEIADNSEIQILKYMGGG